MAPSTHLHTTDLIGTTAEKGNWEPNTVHTHYFGFHIPEAGIGCCCYVRYQPYFPLSQGGVYIFQGTDNLAPLDMAHLDYQITMPYPEVDGGVITMPNGLRIEFTELGSAARLTYSSSDGTSFELLQSAITPLIARGAVVPGENLLGSNEPGGSEQMMHVTGECTLDGTRYDIDCYHARDRSWRQSRTEERGGRHDIPFAWTPMHFPETGLTFNQVGFESPDTDPSWAGIFEIPPGAPTHHHAWALRDGNLLDVVSVRRNVIKQHPTLHAPLLQEIQATDEAGHEYHFVGETIAFSPAPQWPNAGIYDSVLRWTDDQGNVAYGPGQGVWYDRYQKAMKGKREQ